MDLKSRLVSAIGWSFVIKICMQLIIWGMTLVVIRMIAPADYGLVAIVQAIINFALGFASLGMGDALIQDERTPTPLIARVFGLQIVLAVILVVLMCAAAHPISEWYGDPRLITLLQFASITFPLYALMVLPRAYLTKHLRILPMFVIETTSGLISAGTVIYLAWHGYGVWALMWGAIIVNLTKLVLFSILGRQYFVWPRFTLTGIRPLFGFGIFRALEYLVWLIFCSADVMIVGSVAGPEAAGVYVVASNFAAMPLNKVAPIINATLFPAFALVQSRPADARFYVLKAIRMMSAISVPVFFGIHAIAPEIVDLVFGPSWAAGRPILATLALAATFKSILLIYTNFLQGIGDSRAAFWCTLTGALIFLPLFLIGGLWDALGVAYAWLLGYPAVYFVNGIILSKRGSLGLKSILMIPLRPVVAGLIMLVAVSLIRQSIPDNLHPALVLFVLTTTGAVTYTATLFVISRALVIEIANIFRRTASPEQHPMLPDAPRG